jgi:hypothetical protein
MSKFALGIAQVVTALVICTAWPLHTAAVIRPHTSRHLLSALLRGLAALQYRLGPVLPAQCQQLVHNFQERGYAVPG